MEMEGAVMQVIPSVIMMRDAAIAEPLVLGKISASEKISWRMDSILTSRKMGTATRKIKPKPQFIT